MSNEESPLVDLSAEEAERQFPGKSEFVHLHNHTIFSLLDGVAKPIDYFKGCVDRKWPAFAITEHGVLSSIPDAYLSAKECGVKYLVGCEFYFCDYNDRRKKMQEQKIKLSDVRKDQPELASRLLRNRHLTVIAKNEEGYKTLLALNLGAYQDNFYYKPRISLEQLARNKKNIIVLSGCLNGPICHELRAGNISGNDEFIGAIEYVKIFQKMFGDDFYIELQMPGVEGEKEVFQQLVAIANHFKIKMIVANDCCHPDTLVQTSNGLRKISTLNVGDLVLTHRGRFKKIEYINIRKANELICIQIGSEIHKFTTNHPIAVVEGSKIIWKKAGSINKKDKLFYPLMKPLKQITNLNVFDFLKKRFRTRIENGFIRTSSPKSRNINIPVRININDELCYVMGLYAAEGEVDKNADYKLSFSFHKDEKYQINLVTDYFKSFGLCPRLTTVTKNGVRIRICSSVFANLFESLMGNGHLNKRLPFFWNNLNASHLSSLLSGVIDGDGHLRKTLDNISFFSTSLNLVNDVRAAMMRFGWYSSIKFRKQYSDHRPKSNPKQWSKLYYLGYSFRNMAGLRISNNKNRCLWHMPIWPNEKDDYCDNGFKVKIHKIWKESYDGDVYNFQVKNDETYCLTNMCVHNCHYIQREDFTMQKVMMAIDQQLPVDSPDLFHVNSNEQYFKTRYELRASFRLRGFDKLATNDDFERACDNTLEIAEKCKVFKPDLGPKLPSLGDAESELRRLAEDGLKAKGLDKDNTRFLIDNREVSYKEQMEIELERFIEKGFASYFLITRDLVMQSKSRGWPLGPARGSAGGSLVCYLLDIHELNPRKWKLSFNRFLSPSRGGKMLKITME